MFYSVLINSDCFHAIRERATLLKDASISLSNWHSSDYGKILPITDSETLSKIRQFWVKYASFADMPSATQDKARDKFMKDFHHSREKFTGVSLSGLRSIGAPFMDAHIPVIEAFEGYWRTGVVGGLSEFSEDAIHLNPLFVYSNIGGDKCVIHYGADPIYGFHCGTAFAETTHPSPLKQFSQNATLQENIDLLSKTAVLEFNSWCSAFQSFARQALHDPSHGRIYNFCGDALEFCYSLQSALGKIERDANFYETCAAPWKVQVDFVNASGFMGPFDVIDTSNIADHVGLLNILICALPLLKSVSSSALYTENLVQSTVQYDAHERLKFLLCGDPSSIFCLLGAAPMECLTGVTTYCSLHEESMFHYTQTINEAKQLRWRLTWKDMLLSDGHVKDICTTPLIPTWDADSLAQTLVSIYSEMFKEEDISGILESVKNLRVTLIHHTRASFVAMLKFVQRRHHTANWSELFDKVIGLVSSGNPASPKAQGAQEFFLQLHLQRLHTGYVLHESLKRSPLHIPDSWPANFRPSDLTPAIPFLFRIPAARFQPIIKEFNPVTARSDIVFEVNVVCNPFHNKYSILQFGLSDQIQVGDIPLTWREAKDPVVYVYLPTWTILMLSRKVSEISLGLRYNFVNWNMFGSVLGPELIVFQTSIWNTEFVISKFTQQFPPVDSNHAPNTVSSVISGPGFRVSAPRIARANGRLEATIRIDIIEGNKDRLTAGQKVDMVQNSPCTLCVIIGNSKTEIAIPFPTHHSISRLRIARKSGWIEVVAPFATSFSGSPFNFEKFPVIKESNGGYYSWNLSRLSHRLLPQLNLSTTNDLRWINTYSSSAFSVGERTLRENHLKDLSTGDALVDMKENIHSLILMASGVGHFPNSKAEAQKVFFLEMHTAGVMSIIFVMGMRLDQNDCTLVVDSYILPLFPELVSRYSKELAVLRDKRAVVLRCTVDSYRLWTLYIKASVERSRSWKHRFDCTGKLQDGMPDHLQQFLCRCGAGKVTKEFERVKDWKAFAPFVTRCLITPLFPVQCMESIMPENFTKLVSAALSSATSDGSSDNDEKRCLTCKAKEGRSGGKLLTCKGCWKAVYCSKECQKIDWKIHKAACRS